MVTAYWQQPLWQDDVARWLDTDDTAGTVASRVQRLTHRGFEVSYSDDGNLADLEAFIQQQIPPILFVRTNELSYWTIDTRHAVVLGGFTGDEAHVFDPGIDTGPTTISTDELLLAWLHSDYAYAAIEVAS
jgi:ABC-type bacteriocin/lantibiotic exporter with double-glycine peptidase domain